MSLHRRLFQYPFYHLRQGNRVCLPRKSFPNIKFDLLAVYFPVIGIMVYQTYSIIKNFILPAQSLERDRFRMLQRKTAFETVVLSHQLLSGKDKLQERSLF